MLLFVAFLLVVIPALTYHVSKTLFYQKVNSKASAQTPPTIPYLVPGVFHAFSLAYEGPQKYFATLLNVYGKTAPFVVKVGLRPYVVLRDPLHIQKSARASKQLTAHATGSRIHDIIFGASEHYEATKHARADLTRKYLTGASLTTMTDIYVSILSHNLNDKMFQVDSWTQIEDFWSFLQQVLTRCSIETLFGSAILKTYPGLIKDYGRFEDAVESFIPGMPRLLLSAPYDEPLTRLLHGMEKWLMANHSGSEFAKISDDDPDWDEYKGSKFIQEHDDHCAKVPLPLEARTAEMLNIIHCSNANIIPSAIWIMIENLRKPHLAKNFATSISQYRLSGSSTYNVAGVVSLPLFQSTHREISRLRTAQYMVHTHGRHDVQLDHRWTLPTGYTTISFSHDIALNSQLWVNTRPRSVERPLDDFWAERFLIPEKYASKAQDKQQNKESVQVGRFNVEGLELLSPVLGDGQPLAQDSGYSKAIQAATLSVLLCEFEIQPCDSGAIDAAMPPIREVAYGVMRPRERIAVRIRKRKA
ncbi:hypothetical protein BDW02DRAFT_496609 [Decorospora gaudefroyi]|uniref:Cytochrome P450 n=1 Tax=Decorospora gaudefroyi TaxID=184978 RepID=A0A6A5KB81_9PLEO|nr:hypothetical protein BDW02DRAFT_496609 [Decorospora gaudefroyi]